jgi:hypothetical protein
MLTSQVLDNQAVWECVGVLTVWEYFGDTNATFSPRMAMGGRLSHNMTADADYTLTRTEWLYAIIEITENTTARLTARRDIILPAFDGAEWKVFNGTSQPLTFKAPNGPGITVVPGKRQSLYYDGVDVRPAGPPV